jgi:hypothetical protein
LKGEKVYNYSHFPDNIIGQNDDDDGDNKCADNHIDFDTIPQRSDHTATQILLLTDGTKFVKYIEKVGKVGYILYEIIR